MTPIGAVFLLFRIARHRLRRVMHERYRSQRAAQRREMLRHTAAVAK